MKKTLLKIRDFYEIFIPGVAVVLMFTTFVAAVISRYIFGNPLKWSTEVQACMYIWTVLPAACYVRRLDKHVRFTVVYDMLNETGKRAMRIFGNLMIGVLFAIATPYACKYVFTITTVSPVFRLSLTYAYFPMILFLAAGSVYSLYDAYTDIRAMVKPEETLREKGEAAK